MKKQFSVVLVVSLFLFSTVTVSFAGNRHGYRSYNTHRGYNTHFRMGYSHYRGHSGHHYSHSNHYWPYLGIGILTGALIGSVFYERPRPRTVYYTSPPPIIVQSQPRTVYYTSPPPIIVQSQPAVIRQPPRPSTPPTELVLRQVKIIEKIVNIRSGPGLENSVINQAHHNESVDVIGAAPDWLYIKTRDGQYGWLMTQYTYETDRPVG